MSGALTSAKCVTTPSSATRPKLTGIDGIEVGQTVAIFLDYREHSRTHALARMPTYSLPVITGVNIYLR